MTTHEFVNRAKKAARIVSWLDGQAQRTGLDLNSPAAADGLAERLRNADQSYWRAVAEAAQERPLSAATVALVVAEYELRAVMLAAPEAAPVAAVRGAA